MCEDLVHEEVFVNDYNSIDICYHGCNEAARGWHRLDNGVMYKVLSHQ